MKKDNMMNVATTIVDLNPAFREVVGRHVASCTNMKPGHIYLPGLTRNGYICKHCNPEKYQNGIHKLSKE